MAITFSVSGFEFKLDNSHRVRRWLFDVISSESKYLGDISIIWCSDVYLLGINRDYLSHDYYTDIITFDYCDGDVLSGDLFISIETVRTNALEFSQLFHVELLRVVVHGILHLCGYGDRLEGQKTEMREREDYYLSRYEF